MRARTAVTRFARLKVGEAAAFLLSEAARGITGEVLMVDSGFHITGM